MATETYNGYTNYETWNVALWMDNEKGTYDYWRERAQEIWNDATGTQYQTRDEVARYDLMQELKEWHDDNMPEVEGTYADLLSAALSSVNWYEIAENMLDEVDKSGEDDSDDE